MNILKGDTLIYAFDLCLKKSGINIGIMFTNMWSTDDFHEAICSEIRSGRLGDFKICNGYQGEHSVISSPCKSYIHLINIQEQRRLKSEAFDWVLYQEGMSESNLQVIAMAERARPIKSKDTTTECTMEENDELDDFLKSFKITPPCG